MSKGGMGVQSDSGSEPHLRTSDGAGSRWAARWPAALSVLLVVGAGLVWLQFKAGTDSAVMEDAVDGLWGVVQSPDPLTWLVALAVLPVIGFPIAVFYIHAGVAFGPAAGIPLTWLGLAINMSLSYVIGAKLLRAPLIGWLRGRGYRIPQMGQLGSARLVFLMRTIPGPPYAVQNYLLALAGVPFRIYFSVSLLCQGVIAVGMICLGSLIWNWREPGFWVLLAGLGSILLGLRFWLQQKHRRGTAVHPDAGVQANSRNR